MDPDWLQRAKRLQALAQTGLAFTHDAYDRERYEAIRAIAAQMIAEGAARADAAVSNDLRARVDPSGMLDGIFAAQSGYATPKVDVRGAVFRGERILLVRERSDGGWTLPGGWADVGDSPSRAVERETLEESGYTVRAAKLAAVYDRNLHAHTPHLFHIWKLFFLCDLIDGAASRGRAPQGAGASSNETDAADFFALDALPPLSLGRITAAQIAHMFEHHRRPEQPTTFD